MSTSLLGADNDGAMRLDPAPTRFARLPAIDAARGVAILAMMIYHFAWDLRFHGFIAVDVSGGIGWRTFARLIAGSFLLLVGVGLALAAEHGINWPRYLRRLAIITAAAAAITVATWFVFPASYIFFGILHCIALSSVLALPFLRLPTILILLAAAGCLAAPHVIAGPPFDHPALLWLGLQGYFPESNDYVPIFPWFGVVLLGVGLTRIWRKRVQTTERTSRDSGSVVRCLAWAGRHSLPIYLVHQPAFFGLVALAAMLVPPSPAAIEAGFVGSCVRYCTAEGTAEPICRAACGCLASEAQAAGIWDEVLAERLTPLDLDRYRAMAQQCRASAQEEAN